MKKEGTKQKKQVSPPVLILGLLGVAAVFFLLIQPDAGPPPQETPRMAENLQSVPPGSTSETATSLKDENASTAGALQVGATSISGRDPFLPSDLYWIQLKNKPLAANDTPHNLPQQTQVKNIPKSEPVTTPAVTPRVEQPVSRPIWKGTMGTRDDRVVMIYNDGKTHLLRLGDKLPGTQYLVAEIKRDFVLLISPHDKLRLTKTKEVK